MGNWNDNAISLLFAGTVNGVVASFSFLSRILSPIVCGIVMSWSCVDLRPFPLNYHLTFYMLATTVLISCFLIHFIPDAFDRQYIDSYSPLPSSSSSPSSPSSSFSPPSPSSSPFPPSSSSTYRILPNLRPGASFKLKFKTTILPPN